MFPQVLDTIIEKCKDPDPPNLLTSHAGSLCSGLFSASAFGVSYSAPNLRDYVRTHHLHHRKPPLSPGSLPCQGGVFGTSLPDHHHLFFPHCWSSSFSKTLCLFSPNSSSFETLCSSSSLWDRQRLTHSLVSGIDHRSQMNHLLPCFLCACWTAAHTHTHS